MAPVGLKHWMLHNDQLAQEYDETLKLSPGYDPVRAVDPALTFHAPLLTGPDSIPGAIRATFERNSEATYQAPRGAFLLAAGDDESRHEYTPQDEPLGVLMEPATTNKCENWNANPDPALTGLAKGGDASATLTRVQDIVGLEAAGLQNICTSGYVVRLNNTAGSSNAWVSISGGAQNTNTHQGSVYWKGTGNAFLAMITPNPSQALTANYQRFVQSLTPPGAGAILQIAAQPGADVYFILNQLEEEIVPSSVIVTRGGATSRALEQLFWSTTDINGDPVIAQPEGMAAVCQRFGLAGPDFPVQTNTVSILRSANPEIAILYYRKEAGGQESFRSRNDNNQDRIVVLAAPLQANQEYLLMLRWGGGNNQVGYKVGGVTRWSDSGSYTGYSGDSFQISNFLNSQPDIPQHSKNLYFWSVDKGTEWLEDFFAGVAK